MASQLKQVLDHFVEQSEPVSINQLARTMQIEPGVLHDMINYWVRKGKLREVNSNSQACNVCGIKSACPFIIAMPRYFEVVRSEDETETPPCACDANGNKCTV